MVSLYTVMSHSKIIVSHLTLHLSTVVRRLSYSMTSSSNIIVSVLLLRYIFLLTSSFLLYDFLVKYYSLSSIITLQSVSFLLMSPLLFYDFPYEYYSLSSFIALYNVIPPDVVPSYFVISSSNTIVSLLLSHYIMSFLLTSSLGTLWFTLRTP